MFETAMEAAEEAAHYLDGVPTVSEPGARISWDGESGCWIVDVDYGLVDETFAAELWARFGVPRVEHPHGLPGRRRLKWFRHGSMLEANVSWVVQERLSGRTNEWDDLFADSAQGPGCGHAYCGDADGHVDECYLVERDVDYVTEGRGNVR